MRRKKFALGKPYGWVSGIKELYHKRCPGNTCLSSLESGEMGTIEKPINNSKGCGGVMRVAPVGLAGNKKVVFESACEVAAITHGHPSGYLSAGVLAYIISSIIEGLKLAEAVQSSIMELKKWPNHEECLFLLEKAVDLTKLGCPSVDKIRQLGEGWVGEEALAIAVYCALSYPNDFRKALILSVNHDGDSDSTGSITGNILGAYLGIASIPKEWAENVELKDEIIQLSDDLLAGYEKGEGWEEKYPGW